MENHPSPEAAKQPQNIPDHRTTTTMLDCWYDVLFMKCCVSFRPDLTGLEPSKKFSCCLVRLQNIFPKVLGIVKMFFGKYEAFVFFWSAVSNWTLPWMPFLPIIFPIVKSWTLTLTETSEASSYLDMVLGSFVTSSLSRWCALGVISVEQALLGRFTAIAL